MAFKILDTDTAETIHETNDKAKALAVALKYKARGVSVLVLERLPNMRLRPLELAS